MGKQARQYRLPTGLSTNSERRYNGAWRSFLRPVAQALKLKIDKFSSSEATFKATYRKSNGKHVTAETVTLPHWISYKIAELAQYEKFSKQLSKDNQELFEQTQMLVASLQKSNEEGGNEAEGDEQEESQELPA